jgi:hypothetical protein
VNVQLGLGHFAQELGQINGGNSVNFEHGSLLTRLHATQELRRKHFDSLQIEGIFPSWCQTRNKRTNLGTMTCFEK